MSFFNRKEDVQEGHIDKLMNIFSRFRSECVWSKVERNDFTVKRFEDGLVNDVCACILTDDAIKRLKPTKDDFTGVVVKIFNEKQFIPINAVHRATIHTVISDSGLGPKLIFIDDDCSVNEYISDSRPPNLEDDLEPGFPEEVIKMLARFHCLKVPISDKPFKTWPEIIKKFLTEFPGAKDIQNRNYLNFFDENPDLKNYRELFETVDFNKSFDYFQKAQDSLKSPMTFSHMDFHRLNRIIQQNGKSKKVYFVDYDVTMYACRGYDIGAYFDSYLQEKLLFGDDPFPTDEQIIPLLEVYRQECARIKGEEYLIEKRNSIESLLVEVKVWVLYLYLVSIYFALTVYCQDPKDPKKISFAERAFTRQKAGNIVKKRFQDENILPDVGIEF